MKTYYWKFRILFLVLLLSLFFLTAGSCDPTTTLFKSNFDTAIDSPPSAAQAIGTASIHGGSGNVVVVNVPNLTPGRWLKIQRPDAAADVSGFQGKFSEFKGDGFYSFSTVLFIPTDSKAVTVQFESFNQPVSDLSSFLHIDFLENNTVRIDDDPGSEFGTFPRDQAFILKVNLEINASVPKAHILLSGAGATGEASRDIAPPFRVKAREFGAIRLWMGFPHTGHFFANTTVVTRKN